MAYDLIQTNVVFKGRVFDVRQDEVLLPNGRQTRVDLVDHAEAVTILPLDQDGSIWFIRQYRHPAGRHLLELPAGVLEQGELPEIGAARELREETGMAAGHLKKLGAFYLAPGYSNEYLHAFLATDLRVDPLQADEDEFIECVKVQAAESVMMAERGLIEDAKSLAALLLARPYLHTS
jgi:ADP-ribose pyrophosphatase